MPEMKKIYWMKLVTEQEAEKHNDFEHIAMKLSKMKQRKKDLIILKNLINIYLEFPKEREKWRKQKN